MENNYFPQNRSYLGYQVTIIINKLMIKVVLIYVKLIISSFCLFVCVVRFSSFIIPFGEG